MALGKFEQGDLAQSFMRMGDKAELLAKGAREQSASLAGSFETPLKVHNLLWFVGGRTSAFLEDAPLLRCQCVGSAARGTFNLALHSCNRSASSRKMVESSGILDCAHSLVGYMNRSSCGW